MNPSEESSKSIVPSNKSKNENQSKSKTTVTTEQIEQICAITGSTEDVARNLIEACQGNLEMAVNMQMEGVAKNPSVPDKEEEFVRAPIPQKQEVLVRQGYGSYGFGFKEKRKVTPFSNVDMEKESRSSGGNGRPSSSTQGTSTSTGSKNKRSPLEVLFRPPIDLIFKGNLLDARDAGKTHRKWILVNVQNDTEFSCHAINRDVWSQKSIKDLVRENFFFLQLFTDTEEGQRFMNFYKIDSFPYVAVLDPRTGELMDKWNHTNSLAYENLLKEFVATRSWGDDALPLDTPEAKPSESRKRKLETILDAREDNQRQAAVRGSLAASQKKSEEESDSRASEPTRAAPSLPETSTDEDWWQHLGPQSDPHSSIVFRFPDGSKDQKSLPSSSTLMAVIKYVNSKGFPSKKYDLMANFPKRMLLTMDPSMTLKDAGLFPQEQIFVRSRE